MRTAEDLLAELKVATSRLSLAAIVVAIEGETVAAYSIGRESDVLGNLKALIREGGVPVGIGGYLRLPGEYRIYAWPLAELRSEGWPRRHLEEFAEAVAAVIVQRTGGRATWVRPELN